MATAWWLQQRTDISSWIDFGWTVSVGFVGVGAAMLPLNPAWPDVRQLVVAAWMICWSLRLASHLLRRARRGHDDPRYAELSRQWGDDAKRRMFWFAQAQAVAALPLVLAALLAAHRPGLWPGWLDVLGSITLGAGLVGAAVSDRQLSEFASLPAHRGKVCDQGLWRWSRHPNYFFEWLGWMGLAITASDPGGEYPAGWLAILAPIAMYWLLVHVSGIPPLEAHMAQTRGDVWKSYCFRTSAFFPWPPHQ